jgi:hypothetical protein
MYLDYQKKWIIQSDASSDTLEIIYVIRNYNIYKDKYKIRKVRATGYCIQSDKPRFAIHDALPPVSIYYYFDVKTFKFKWS